MKELLPYHTKDLVEVGCDEAGRGCLAGPVVAAAVILNPEKPIKGLNDSKQTNLKERVILRKEIESNALAFNIGVVSNTEIDEINILNASFLAMHRAIDKLQKYNPEHLIIDGNRFNPYKKIPHTCIVKGDARYQSIAAASILAKTFRDDVMMNLSKKHECYDWNNNKGYPTKKHRNALILHGKSIHHRNSFNLYGRNEQLDLFD